MNEVSSHFKLVSHGDTSEGGTWKFDGEGFGLKKYYVDAFGDRKADPETVFEADQKKGIDQNKNGNLIPIKG